jgi:hypothetical protein
MTAIRARSLKASSRGIYTATIHASAANPGGELRGQLEPCDRLVVEHVRPASRSRLDQPLQLERRNR